MERAVYRGFQALAWLFLAGAVLQFFLAGLGVFGAASFVAHVTVGTVLGIISLVLLVLAVLSLRGGDLPRRSVILAALLVVLMIVQWLLVEVFSRVASTLAALHPVNGLLILAVTYGLATGHRRS